MRKSYHKIQSTTGASDIQMIKRAFCPVHPAGGYMRVYLGSHRVIVPGQTLYIAQIRAMLREAGDPMLQSSGNKNLFLAVKMELMSKTAASVCRHTLQSS